MWHINGCMAKYFCQKIAPSCIRMTCYERLTITVAAEDDTEEDVDDKYQLKSRKQA